MYYKIKVTNPNQKGIITYFTEAVHFAEAAKKVIELVGTGMDIEEVKLMKNIKPAINERYSEYNKLYMVKIAEDIKQEDNTIKTIKYELPCFANNAIELTDIVNDYIKQGLETMRLTTISETKWIYI